MAYIEAERFAELKARVKAECLRRCHTGSVAEYGGEKYEYTNSPTEDHTVDVEHYEKLALPLSKIHSEKVPSLDGRRIVFDEDITVTDATLSSDIAAWDSLTHITLISEVEDTFGMKFSMKDVLGMKNVGEMADIIEKNI